jgi:hypothetical protein
VQAPSLPEGNALSRGFKRYHRWHVDRPIRPQRRRFIYRMLLGGVTLIVTGLVLAGVAAVYAAQIDAETKGALLKGGVGALLAGLCVFSLGYAYRVRGWEDEVSDEQRTEMASLLIFSEICGFA